MTRREGNTTLDAVPMPMPAAMLPPLSLGTFFSRWEFHLGWSILTALLALGYAAGVIAARRRGRHWPAARVASWAVGLLLLVLSTQGGIAVYGGEVLFWVHMVGHLLLIMGVPLVLLWGQPAELAIAAAGERGPAVERALRGRIAAVVTFPLFSLALYTVAIIATHLTGFMNAMMSHPWLRGFEGGLYLVAGLLFFAPIAGSPPLRWRLTPPMRMFMMVVAMPVDTFTGVILIQTERYPWPAMAAAHPSWAMSLLDDLHAGGAVMWIGGDAVMALLMGVAAVAWARIAGSGTTSELGNWLSSARINYQRDAIGGPDVPEIPTGRTGDSDEDLADYNAYLARLNARDGSDGRG